MARGSRIRFLLVDIDLVRKLTLKQVFPALEITNTLFESRRPIRSAGWTTSTSATDRSSRRHRWANSATQVLRR